MVVLGEVARVFRSGQGDHGLHPVPVPIFEAGKRQDHVFARPIETETRISWVVSDEILEQKRTSLALHCSAHKQKSLFLKIAKWRQIVFATDMNFYVDFTTE